MRNLYQIIESILDTDKQVISQTEENLLPSAIMSCLKKHFNEYLERGTKIKKMGQWYILGKVDDDLYDKESIGKTEKFVISAIKQMHLDIKKAVPYTIIDVDANWKERFGEIYFKKYTVTLKNSKEEYVIEFNIHAKQYKFTKLEEIEYIAIWTKNKELAELL